MQETKSLHQSGTGYLSVLHLEKVRERKRKRNTEAEKREMEESSPFQKEILTIYSYDSSP